MIDVGNVYGIYIVKNILDERDRYGHKKYLLECSICHENVKLTANKFAYPNTIVHNCCHKNLTWSSKRISGIWRKMVDRCYNSNSKSYRFYGAKGIKICDEWLNNPCMFDEWSLNNGYRDDLTIDRVDSSKPYCPENCRWISAEDNSRFKSTTNYIEVDGILKSGKQWSIYLGFGINHINRLLRKFGIEYTENFIKEQLNGIQESKD